MADGAACFGQGSSDPALLRVPARLGHLSRTGLSPAPARLSRHVPLRLLLPRRLPYNPARASTPAVWAGPLSLAATRGVTLVFLSSAYLDVSVRRVRPHHRWVPRPRAAGFPIRAPADPRLLAPPRGLSRPAAPFFASGSHRHPPCALSRLSRRPTRVSPRRARSSLVFLLLSRERPPLGERPRFLPSCQRTPAAPSGGTWRMWGSNPRPPACKAGALAD